jgi:protein O-GlcNAc transferase
MGKAEIGAAVAIHRKGDIDAAEALYRRILDSEPDNVEALHLLGVITLQRGDAAGSPEFRPALYHELLRIAAWDGLGQLGAAIDRQNEAALAAGQAAPESAFLNLLRSEDPAENLRIARSHARQIESRVAWAAPLLRRTAPAPRDGRIRVGYLTWDIWDHPTAHLTGGLFAAHDRAAFDVYLYSYGPDDGSGYRRAISSDVEHFVELRGMDRLAAAQRIADDRIDILVDLKGHTMEAWLDVLALRPAPIQLHWLGFPGSIGGKFLDYLIADHTVLPNDQFIHYSEKIVRLPHCYQVNDDRQAMATPVTRAEAGLPEDAIVLCCFNHPHKFDRETFDLWLTLLGENPDTVLWLLDTSPEARTNLEAAARKRGIAHPD